MSMKKETELDCAMCLFLMEKISEKYTYNANSPLILLIKTFTWRASAHIQNTYLNHTETSII